MPITLPPFNPQVVLTGGPQFVCGVILRSAPVQPNQRPSAESAAMVAQARLEAQRSADLLELLVVTATTLELAVELQLKTIADVMASAKQMEPRLRALSSIDLEQLAQRGGSAAPLDAAVLAMEVAPLHEAARQLVASLLASGALKMLQTQAAALHLPTCTYRVTVAFETFAAYLRRTDPSLKRALAAVGRLYESGRATVADCADLLQMRPEDVVAELEALGFGRSVETIRLSAEQRSDLLARTRVARLSGSLTASCSDEGLVRRSVIASTRIEGVDARKWLPAT